jgi:hypothetical protein
MRPLSTAVLLAALALSASAVMHAQAGAAKFTLDKAAVVTEAKNDSRQAIVPPAGQAFLWVKATAAGAATTIDLTRIALTNGAAKGRLVGVDAAYDGDPKEFSMIADAHLKTGNVQPPLEETKSVGMIGFSFTPGKAASVKVVVPPQSFCLLFEVPSTLKAGQIAGLGPKPLTVPPLSSGRQ